MMTLEAFLTEWNSKDDRLLVHTSGSTGKPKPMWVEKRRMEASARTTCNFLGLQKGDTALLCMNLDYIAGKMMVVRALTCGLRLLAVAPSGHPLSGPLPWDDEETIDFAAMVPLQVYNTLLVPEERERLMRIRHLIIGGGAIDERLQQELKGMPHAVWSTYGMTETLSHIALRRLNGPEESLWYTPFEGVSVSLTDDNCLVIDAPAVHEGRLVTNDVAELYEGRFRILGRKDNVVCSGGIKLQIEEIEEKLRVHMRVPFLLSKKKDERLGEALVMVVEAPDAASYRSLCEKVLSKYEVPRYYYSVDRLPRTETGKPARYSWHE